MSQDQGQRDNVDAHPIVRPLGRTRVELVPRDSSSVFVFWEVADPTPSGDDATSETFVIELRREDDGEVASSFDSRARLDGQRVDVDPGGRYWAALNLRTDEGLQRLARSTSSAGPLPRQDSVTFVELTAGEGSRPVDVPDAPSRPLVDWTARKTDSSSR